MLRGESIPMGRVRAGENRAKHTRWVPGMVVTGVDRGETRWTQVTMAGAHTHTRTKNTVHTRIHTQESTMRPQRLKLKARCWKTRLPLKNYGDHNTWKTWLPRWRVELLHVTAAHHHNVPATATTEAYTGHPEVTPILVGLRGTGGGVGALGSEAKPSHTDLYLLPTSHG